MKKIKELSEVEFEIEKAIDKRLNVFDLEIEKQKSVYYIFHGTISFFILLISTVLLAELFTCGNMTSDQFSLIFVFSVICSSLIYYIFNQEDPCGFKYNLLKDEETQKIIKHCNEKNEGINKESIKDYEPFKYSNSMGLLDGEEISPNEAYKARFDFISKADGKFQGIRFAFNSRSGRETMRLPKAFENYVEELKMQNNSIVIKKEKKKIKKYLERKTQYYSYIKKYLKSPSVIADLKFLKYAYRVGDSFAKQRIEEIMSLNGSITYAQLDELLPVYLLEKQILNLADEYIEDNYEIMKKFTSVNI